MPIPHRWESAGEENSASLPSIRIEPESFCKAPERTFINVDLPAPFSPSRQCTSPARRSKLTLSRASTPGYCFRMFCISRRADISIAQQFCQVHLCQLFRLQPEQFWITLYRKNIL